ncbi:MAG: hypothetical protein S4CHLAM20_10050 [Chlamydiia bacterium]|nr:hypothetical protein [Chlamydiia bacterium]
MSKTIVKAVLGVVFLDDKVILTKRRDIPLWVLPGGAIDEGETADETIIREVKEETGYDVKIDRKIGLFSFSAKFIDSSYLYKLSVINDEKINHDHNEVKEVKAFALNDLPYETLPLYVDWIKEALEDNPYYEKEITTFSPLFILKAVLSHPILVCRYFLSRLGLPVNT